MFYWMISRKYSVLKSGSILIQFLEVLHQTSIPCSILVLALGCVKFSFYFKIFAVSFFVLLRFISKLNYINSSSFCSNSLFAIRFCISVLLVLVTFCVFFTFFTLTNLLSRNKICTQRLKVLIISKLDLKKIDKRNFKPGPFCSRISSPH